MVKLIWQIWSWIIAVFFTICFLEIGWEWVNSLDSQEFMVVSFIGLSLSLLGLFLSARKLIK